METQYRAPLTARGGKETYPVAGPKKKEPAVMDGAKPTPEKKE
jgi:hypothetical protein